MMEEQLFYTEEKSYHLSDDLVDTSKFDPSDLKLDIKSGKILVFITLFMLTGVNMIERFLI